MNMINNYEPAPPQNFIGPRFYPIKYLPCRVCGGSVRVADKYRHAKTAVHGECWREELNSSSH